MKARHLARAGACTLAIAAVGCSPAKPEPADTVADPLAGERREMVRRQIEHRGILDQRILDAMRLVPRHEFVPADARHLAYSDQPLPIGHGQTISQPYIVAFMTEALAPQPGDKVLEIGTGSGYQAAVLASLVRHVYTIEIVKPLADQAAATLRQLGYANVTTKAGDGHLGWPEHAPFDAIIVTCAPDHVPEPLVKQLRDGGRMIIPVGAAWEAQQLYLLEKRGAEVVRDSVLPVRFVPMTGPGDPTP